MSKGLSRASRRATRLSLQQAVRNTIEPLERRRLLSISLSGIPTWTPLGPNPIIAGSGDNVIGPTAATSIEVGAVNAIAVDPNNSKHLVVGTVDGGIWQTADFTVANPNWTTTSDFMPSLAISAVAFSPSNSSIIYAGTGNYSSTFGGVGGAGLGGSAAGVYESTNGGATWQLLNPNGIFTGLRIRRIVPTTLNGGQTVFLATTDTTSTLGTVDGGGIYRSDDGGANWARVSGANGLPNAGATDLVANPADANEFFAAVAGGSGAAGGTGGIFRLDLAVNNTWSNITGNINTINAGVLNSAARVELAISPAGTNPIWASVINSGGFYSDIFRGPDTATVTWAAVGPGGLPPDVLEGNQGSVHGAIAADPGSDTIVYLGGDARQNVSPFSAYLARGDSGANTWTAMTPIDSANGHPGQTVIPTGNGVTTAPHPDARNLVLGSGGVLLLACDGGVYQATSPNGAGPALAWSSINGNLQNTELYQAVLDNRNTASTADDLIGGAAQDNSASERNTGGTWNTQVGGDGTVVLADPISDTRYFSVQNYFMGRIIGGGGISRPAGTVAGTGGKILNQGTSGTYAESFPFTPTVVLNQGDIATNATARVLLGGNRTLYLSSDQASNFTSIGGTASNIPSTVTNLTARVIALAFGAAVNTNVCYVAMSDGNIAMTSNITTAGGGFSLTTFATAAAGALPQSMAIEPNDASTIYITTLNGVFRSTNAGATWTNISDNLGTLISPNFPQFTNQTGERGVALFDNGTATAADDILLVGAPGGVFRRAAAAAPGANWTQYGAALPNVLVDSLQYDGLSDTVLAGTFGRGAWSVGNTSASISSLGVLTINGDSDFAGEDDNIRIVRDAGNPAMLDVLLNSTFATFPLASIQQINVNGLGGNDNLTLDSANGLISIANGTRYDGGGGFDSLTLAQNGGPVQASDSYAIGPNTGEGTSVITGPSGSQSVSFQNLAPVIDTVPAAGLAVNATAEDNAISYTAGAAGRGKVLIDAYESIEFSNKTQLTINASFGSDSVSLDNPSTPTGLTKINVNGGDPTASDSLVVNGIAGQLDNLRELPTGVGAGAVVNDNAPQPEVDFTGIEHLTMVVQSVDGDGVRVDGTVGNDRVEFFSDPTGVSSATFSGTMDQNNATGAGPFAMVATTATGLSPAANDTDVNFFNPGGSDNFIFNGTPANETIAVGTGEAGGIEFRNTIGAQIVARVEVFNIAAAIVRGLGGMNTINCTAPLSIPLTIDGGGGATANLTGNGTAMAATLGSTTSVTGGGLNVSLLGVSTINLNAGAGAIALTGGPGLDVFTLTVTGNNSASVQDGPLPLLVNTTNTGALSFDGGAQSTADSFTLKTTGAAAVTYQPISASSGNLTAGATGISLSNIQSLRYDGQGGNAALSVSGSAGDDSFVHTPAAAGDAGNIAVNLWLPLSYQNLGAGGSLTVNGNAGSDTLVYNGTAAGDNFSVNGAGAVTLNARVPVSAANVETLTLQGLAGDDTFTLVPAISASPYAVMNFLGGESSAGDVANLVGTAGADDFNISGTSISLGGKTVNSGGVETENLNALGGVDSLHYFGVAGVTEAINVAASPTAGSGRIYAAGLMNVVFASADFVDVNGNLPDNDTLTFFGTNNVDVINIHADAVGSSTAPVLQLQTATAATLLTLTNYTGIQTLGVDALDGEDVINVYTGPSIGRSLLINGNAPTGKKKLTDVLNVFYVMPKPRIIHSTTTQSPQSGLVSLDYGTSQTLVQYSDIENVVIRRA